MPSIIRTRHFGRWLLLGALVVTAVVYWPGLSGGWLFDDYPNIVDNHGVQPSDASVPSLVRAAMSSPASEFKRPLASLSFAANYLATGLDPYGMKLTNLLIHLLNGLLVFLLARALLLDNFVAPYRIARSCPDPSVPSTSDRLTLPQSQPDRYRHAEIVAALITAGWMLLPINLTGVLYVVQRMESMANAFVLLGLIGYVAGRRRMLATPAPEAGSIPSSVRQDGHGEERPSSSSLRGLALCVISLIVPTALGLLAKETAVMLPLYAVLIEWALFRFRKPAAQLTLGAGPVLTYGETPVGRALPAAQRSTIRRALTAALSRRHPPQEPAGSARPTGAIANRVGSAGSTADGIAHAVQTKVGAAPAKRDWRIVTLFLLVLVLPLLLGLVWLLPHLLTPEAWATRNFTLDTRLLSEARIVSDYIRWTLLPTPDALSFYHDDFRISTGWLTPWTTLASSIFLAALIALMLWLRSRRPLAALGIALFLGCQLLTGTILPLELIYEHRNYFASVGLLLAVVPLLAAPGYKAESAGDPERDLVDAPVGVASVADGTLDASNSIAAQAAFTNTIALPMALPRYVLLGGLLLCWTTLTAFTAYAWGSPLRLAEDLALRAPQSPRAQYELGRTYIIYSHYDPMSPFTPLVYAPLERAAALPDASILPEQALIFMNARLHRPLRDAWWDSMIAKLKSRPLGVQDESSLSALTRCARQANCDLPHERMQQAFTAALSHPDPNARLLATYGDYAWNVLDDHPLGLRMTERAVRKEPDEPAYRITLVRMLVAQGRKADAVRAMEQLEELNIGGRLDTNLSELRALGGWR